ncbi:MAG: hypothetical protein FJW39_19920 [Acidobacteria bacterium]|nr:hypothetical protein [Acidobacteriota bacterium]
MKKFAFILALSVAAYAESFTGYLVDAKCGKAHAKDAGKGCASKCISGGQAAKLVVGDDVHDIDDASQQKAKDYVAGNSAANLKVTIQGSKGEHGIKITSIAAAQ